jgi:MOSC domain-containing protein YiiM
MMHLSSVNVGLPREIVWEGQPVKTGIFKQPVSDPVRVLAKQLEGDGQADLRVHGGPDKSVYAYALEHYDYWRDIVPPNQLTDAAFGENLTTTGLLETQVCIGDVFRMGTAVLMAVQPRMPCYKLGIRLDDARMVKQFVHARRSGIYFRVLEQGVLQAGDAITLLEPAAHAVTIQQVVDNFWLPNKDAAQVQDILAVPVLPAFWQRAFREIQAAL